jgi:hypothetical protein
MRGMLDSKSIRRLIIALESIFKGQRMGDIDPELLGKWKAYKTVLEEEY